MGGTLATENGEPPNTDGAIADRDASGDIVICVLTGKLATSGVGTLGTVVDGADPATGDRAIAVNANDMRSTSRLKDDGSASLEAAGDGPVGKRAEGRAIGTLRQRLRADGHAVSVDRGEDHRGEDRKLTIDGVNFVVQIVTVPGSSTFWRQARTGTATAGADDDASVDWLRQAIEAKARKTPPAQRRGMILALDAQHAGVLADDHIIGGYLKRFGPPKVKFGFAAVWVVGPTVERCVRVGD
jgi:hypothetical protein